MNGMTPAESEHDSAPRPAYKLASRRARGERGIRTRVEQAAELAGKHVGAAVS